MRRHVAILAAPLFAAACVQPQHDSRIIANFESLGPPALVVTGVGAPLVSPHYELWATIRQDSVARLLAFDVTPVVDLASPCLMYDAQAALAYHGEVEAGEPVMGPLPDCTAADAAPDCTAVAADKAWLQARATLLAGSVLAVTSASDGFDAQTELDLSKCETHGETGDLDCWLDHAAIVPGSLQLVRNDTLIAEDGSAHGIPAANKFCMEASSGRITLDAAIATGTLRATYRAHLVSPAPQSNPLTWPNAARLRACELPSTDDPDFYIGNLVQLTAPRNGQFYGLVDTLDPTAGVQLGGIAAQVPFALDQATEIFVTVEDHSVGSPDASIGNRVDPERRGAVVLGGLVRTGGADSGRGLLTADLAAPANITIGGLVPGGHVSIYVNLDADNVQF